MTTTQQTPSPSIPDLRPLLLQACGVTDRLVALVTPADLDRPTPCTDFDVRGLLDHLVMVLRRVRVVLQGGRFDEVPQVTGLADTDLTPAWAAGLADLTAAVPGVDLGAMATAPFGVVPRGAAVAMYANEITVHTWDLAAALDRTDLVDPSWARPLLDMVEERLPREGREHVPFGEVVDLPADASDHDRLLAWMGRDPAWCA